MVKLPGIAKSLLPVLTFCWVFLSAPTTLAQSLQLEGPSSTVREGYFTVSVVAQEQREEPLTNLVIDVSAQADFSHVEQTFPALGDFRKLSLTGFSDGVYYLRARADNLAEPSNVIKVTVQHYPLWQALGLFFTGLIIFALLVVILLRSHRRVEKEVGND